MRIMTFIIIFITLFSCGYFSERQGSFSLFTAIELLESIKKYTGDTIVIRPSYEDLDYDKLCAVDSTFYYKYLNGRNQFCPYIRPDKAKKNDCTQFFYGIITNANTGHKQLVICQKYNPLEGYLGEWFLLNFLKEELVGIFPVASIENSSRHEILKSSIIFNYNILHKSTCKRIFEDVVGHIDNERYFLCTDSINVKYRLHKFQYLPDAKDSVRICNWVENS